MGCLGFIFINSICYRLYPSFFLLLTGQNSVCFTRFQISLILIKWSKAKDLQYGVPIIPSFSWRVMTILLLKERKEIFRPSNICGFLVLSALTFESYDFMFVFYSKVVFLVLHGRISGVFLIVFDIAFYTRSIVYSLKDSFAIADNVTVHCMYCSYIWLFNGCKATVICLKMIWKN